MEIHTKGSKLLVSLLPNLVARRVTLVVDWLFLPQNVGSVAGTYKGLLLLRE